MRMNFWHNTIKTGMPIASVGMKGSKFGYPKSGIWTDNLNVLLISAPPLFFGLDRKKSDTRAPVLVLPEGAAD